MQLVSIESAEEQKELSQILDQVKEGRFHWWWTSGSDENEEDQWTWTANGEPFTFINWNKWQPNGGTENNYMLMVSSYYRFEWYDVDAQEQSFSICERHLDS